MRQPTACDAHDSFHGQEEGGICPSLEGSRKIHNFKVPSFAARMGNTDVNSVSLVELRFGVGIWPTSFQTSSSRERGKGIHRILRPRARIKEVDEGNRPA